MWKVALGCFLGLTLILGIRIADVVGASPCKGYQGAALLALTHDRFPLADAIKLLKPLNCPAVGVLYRTFGYKLSRIKTLQRSLGKRLKVLLYGDCGPCRYPRRPKNYAPHFRPDLSINDLNSGIVGDRGLRRQFTRKVILPAFNFIQSASGYGIIFEYAAILEDDLSSEAWKRIASLQRSEKRRLGIRVKIKRNPLRYIPNFEWPIEAHTCYYDAPSYLRKGDSLSLDGTHVAFAGEYGNCRASRLVSTVKLARSRGVDFYLWRAPWQGLVNKTGILGAPVDKRTYVVDMLKESTALLQSF